MELRYDNISHGVYIVTAAHGAKRGGMAVAWATQLGKDCFLLAIGKQSYTWKLIEASGSFGLSVLAKGQETVGYDFGTRSGHKVDKFDKYTYHKLKTGSPLLDDCAATFDCEIETVLDHAPHKLVIGRVVDAEKLRDKFEPLIYRQEDYESS